MFAIIPEGPAAQRFEAAVLVAIAPGAERCSTVPGALPALISDRMAWLRKLLLRNVGSAEQPDFRSWISEPAVLRLGELGWIDEAVNLAEKLGVEKKGRILAELARSALQQGKEDQAPF